jgi:FtsP/CotA-like multicopper oxidase with cupredoxin domain
MLGALMLALILGIAGPAGAMIDGLPGTVFNLTASEGYIGAPDGGRIYTWGFGPTGGAMQYPGPTLILDQGAAITINLTNNLPPKAGPVSMVFPGHAVTASGGVAGLATQEAPVGGTVTYTFTATHPGTYLYYSGTQSDLQVEMGLAGTIIVRPTGYDPMMNRVAYDHPDSAYDHEYLFFLTEMDPVTHREMEGCMTCSLAAVDTTQYWPTYWFINGRCAPDTMAPANALWLPNQPYNSMPMMEPGDRVLMRFVGGGRDLHPFHHHGNNATVIAQDGRLLSSAPGMGADAAYSDFTQTIIPGGTLDAIFEWTGQNMGWDIYGHAPDADNDPVGDFPGVGDVDWNEDGIIDPCPPLEMGEDPNDHCKPFPVNLPHERETLLGGMWSGSPFLGGAGALAPGEGGMNPWGGYTYMWHSHNEKEMTNNNIFPGGLMTMLIIVPPGMMGMH